MIISHHSLLFYIKSQHDDAVYTVHLRYYSFNLYIKPQLPCLAHGRPPIVIHSISTSNHNSTHRFTFALRVVIHSISTSNHN